VIIIILSSSLSHTADSYCVYVVKLDAASLALCSQYQVDSHDVRQVEDEVVVEDPSEDGYQNHRQLSGTSVDRCDL